MDNCATIELYSFVFCFIKKTLVGWWRGVGCPNWDFSGWGKETQTEWSRRLLFIYRFEPIGTRRALFVHFRLYYIPRRCLSGGPLSQELCKWHRKECGEALRISSNNERKCVYFALGGSGRRGGGRAPFRWTPFSHIQTNGLKNPFILHSTQQTQTHTHTLPHQIQAATTTTI